MSYNKHKNLTFETARKLTLKKWKRVLKNIEKIGEDEECGFCFLSTNTVIEHEGQKKRWRRCYYCLVKDKCEEIQKQNRNLLYEYMTEVNTLIRWLEKTNEKDLKSLYQLKGGG